MLLTASSVLPTHHCVQHTQGYSGADITEICQRAVKYAIRESIEKVCGLQNRTRVLGGSTY